MSPIGRCAEERASIAPEDVTSLGFSAADVLPLATQMQAGSLTWARGSATTLNFTLTSPQLAFVTSKQAPGAGVTSASSCHDYLEIKGHARLATQDGALEEEADAVLEVAKLTELRGRLLLDADELQGSAMFESPGECLLAVNASFMITPTGFSGTLLGSVAKGACADVGDDSAVMPLEIASWRP